MLKKVLKTIGGVLSYALIALEAIFLIVMLVGRINGGVPKFFGYSLYTIGSGSMEPELQIGDVILSKEYKDGDVLNPNDIITYQGQEGTMAGKIITHRVVEVYDDGTILTKGDANASSDPIIDKSQVYSVMVCKCFVIGLMYKILSSTVGFIIFLVVPLGYLIISEIINIAKAKVEAESEENKK